MVAMIAASAHPRMLRPSPALKRAGSADPAKYLPEIAKTDYQGVTGPVKFDGKGDIQQATVSLYRLKQGQWVGL